MGNVYEGLNSEATGARVTKGKANEKAVAECLNKHHGFQLQESSDHEDRYKKQDYYDGTHKYQIKSRASGTDILYDLWEPFYGLDDPRTQPGRDHIGQYDKFVCLSKDEATIRIVGKNRLREIVGDLIEEFKEKGGTLPLYSRKHRGCQLRWHQDKWSGTPKVLCFVRPSALDKDEIQVFPMVWDNT